MTATTTASLQQHFNYAVSFSDRTVKVGITSAPFHRLQDFIQEARRHALGVTGFSITPPAKSKGAALRVERALCEWYADYAVEGHREWFRDDLEWCRTARLRKMFANHISRDVFYLLRWKWDEENGTHFAREWLQSQLLGINSTSQSGRYEKVIEFAEALGRSGNRISATGAAALAAQMVPA